jgi:hypothetical protein
MGELRVRIKLGDHEFEAEGPTEPVERQAEAFHRIFAPPPTPSIVIEGPPMPSPAAIAHIEAPGNRRRKGTRNRRTRIQASACCPGGARSGSASAARQATASALRLDEILHRRGPIVALSVKAKLQDAVLAILLGHRVLGRNENVSDDPWHDRMWGTDEQYTITCRQSAI